MVAAKKVEMPADEVYLQSAMRAGTCSIQEVSLKALGEPDTAFQARVVHIDMGHVHRLSQIHDVQGSIGPVVVFRSVAGAVVRMILADGFHRHEMARRKGLPALRAYVVDVDGDRLEHEARLYAAMCNQQLSLTRTREDVRKAVKMLLEDEECWGWTDRRIANHCGFSPHAVTRCRLEVSEERDRPVPGISRTKAGHVRVRTCGNAKVIRNGRGGYRANIDGREINLGTSAEGATSQLGEIVGRREAQRNVLDGCRFQELLVRRGFLMRTASPDVASHRHLRGCHGHGVVLTTARVDAKDTVPWAVGCLVGLLALCGEPAARLVVVCFPEDGPAATIDLYRGLGFEFLTPDELIESLGREGAGDGS